MKQKIVPYEKQSFKDEEIFIDDISVTYVQNTDVSGLDGEETVQTITISTRNNGVDRFINIKTDSWSIDDIDSLENLIKDFKNKAMLDDSCD